jgi:hypothetical protein
MAKGWKLEPGRHALAAKGVPTGRKMNLPAAKSAAAKSYGAYEAKLEREAKEAGYEDDESLSAVDKMLTDDKEDPKATLISDEVFSSGSEQGSIGEYHDDSEGQIAVRWVDSGGYRGYYESYAPKGSNYVKVHDDNILAYSEDEAKLKEFDDEVTAGFKEKGVKWMKVFPRSSNLFSTGYDLFVRKNNAKQAEGIIKAAAEKHRPSYIDTSSARER